MRTPVESPAPRSSPRAVGADDGAIAIVVLTYNRLQLLRKCVENVLMETSNATTEIVIWDNGSTDGTRDYLKRLTDPRIRVVESAKNIGQNAYPRAFGLTTALYMIELDDDVVEAPSSWDRTLRDAFRLLPRIGFLSADLEDDPNDIASQHRHHLRAHEYTPAEVNGVRLLRGPTGGGCALTSRELYDRIGGFKERKNEVFFLEDAVYVEDLKKLGYEAAILADLKVHHTGGPFYSAHSKEKDEYWARWTRARARRAAVKRVVFRLPFFERLNERFGWIASRS
jgi:GT2 family glycosyltransferase